MSLENKIRNLILSKLAPPDFTPGLDTFSGDVRDEKVDCSSAPDPDDCERRKQETQWINRIFSNPPAWLRVGCTGGDNGVNGCPNHCGENFCNQNVINSYAVCEGTHFHPNGSGFGQVGFYAREIGCECKKENYNFQTGMYTGDNGPLCDLAKAHVMFMLCPSTIAKSGDCINYNTTGGCFDGIPYPPSVANAFGVANGSRQQVLERIIAPGYTQSEWMQVRNKWAANATICRTDYCQPDPNKDLLFYSAEQHGGRPREATVAIPDTDPVEYTVVCVPWDPNTAGPEFWDSYWATVSQMGTSTAPWGESLDTMMSLVGGNNSGQVVDGVPIPPKWSRYAYDIGCWGKPYQEQLGACCKPAGDFGGFECSQTRSEDCSLSGGVFHAGRQCGEIGGDNCGGVSPIRKPNNDLNEITENEEVVTNLSTALIRSLRGKK